MTKVKAFAGRHKKLLITLGVFVVIVAVAIGLLGSMRPVQGAAFVQDTGTLQRVDLSLVVTGSGTVQSATTKSVTSSLSYEITEVLVEVGDSVTAGQKLVELDTSELEQNIQEVRRSISDANASDALSREQAQRKYQDAVNQRDIDQTRLDSEVNAAYTAWQDAQSATAGKLAALQNAEAALNGTNAEDALYAALNTAYELAQQEYNAAVSAESGAKTAYDAAVTTRDTTLRQDNLNIENAQDTLNTLSLSSSAKTYQNQLTTYERQLVQAEITAPVTGTVTAVNAEAGSSAMAAAGALFTIEDTTSLEVPISVAEYDVNDVKVGMNVEVTSDALDGEVWQGTVSSISPVASDTAGNFTVTVKITSAPGQLKSGMSAKASILVEEVKDVFAVPYDAVVEKEDGSLVIYEHLGGEAGEEGRREVAVSSGMEGDYYIEISGDGLYEGMEILNDPLGANVAAADMPFGIMGGGF